jgi:hypothetical protein
MVQFRRFFDGRAFVIGVAIAVVGAMTHFSRGQEGIRWTPFISKLAM